MFCIFFSLYVSDVLHFFITVWTPVSFHLWASVWVLISFCLYLMYFLCLVYLAFQHYLILYFIWSSCHNISVFPLLIFSFLPSKSQRKRRVLTEAYKTLKDLCPAYFFELLTYSCMCWWLLACLTPATVASLPLLSCGHQPWSYFRISALAVPSILDMLFLHIHVPTLISLTSWLSLHLFSEALSGLSLFKKIFF